MAAARDRFWSFSPPAAATGPGRGRGLALGARTLRTKGPHVPAPEASSRLPSPPEDRGFPSRPPHTLAHALWSPHAHVLNPRRPSSRLQLWPGLPVSLRTQTAFVRRKIMCRSQAQHCHFQTSAGALLGLIKYMFVLKFCRNHSFCPPGLYFQC